MRKYIGYIPAILFTGFYLLVGLTGASMVMSMILIWLACFWISAFLFHKGLFWGGIFGLIPGLHMIYMGTQYTGQVINVEIPLGIVVLLFYVIFGFYLWKKKDTERNQGSGSQSMLERFMGDKLIMEAPTELVNSMMSGIIEKVSNYRSKSNSIGFSFRYYVEGIIQNPDIKMLSVDGVAPTAENIKNGSYPIITPIYAVTYEENTNENVDKLLDWILSEEGQYIIEATGYVGITSDFIK